MATHSLTLNWVASTDVVQGYNVYRALTSGGEATSTTPINATLVTGTTYTDSTLAVGNTYYYEIRSIVGALESVVSTEVASQPVTPFPPTDVVITGQV